MKNKLTLVISIILAFTVSSTALASVPTVKMEPLSKSINVSNIKASVSADNALPQITWAEDMRMILANGNAKQTANSSLFGDAGLSYELKLSDSVVEQTKKYISGKTPYFRGTMSQVVQLNELVQSDPDLHPVVIDLLSWSKGGDVLTVSKNINSLKDLKGKKIAAMAYGPHVYFVWRTLKSAGLEFSDVEMVWVKDLLGTNQTPAQAFCDATLGVDAAFMIAPEADSVISGDNACKGAKSMFSTIQASNVIADVYAVRSDFFALNKESVSKFVHTQMIAKEKADQVFKDSKSSEYKKWMKASAKLLLGDEDLVEDVEGMFQFDAKHAGFAENVSFFTDKMNGRNFERLTAEINDALLDMKLIEKKYPLAQANWDWSQFKSGLKNANLVNLPTFNKAQTKKIVTAMQANDTIDSEQFLTEEVKFEVGKSTFVFSPVYHTAIFNKIIDEAVTYGNTLIIIQAHSDPSHYLIQKIKYKAPETELKRIRQKAWNLSIERAKEVRQAIISYALEERKISLDESQFEFIGYGIEKPLTGICGNEPCKLKLKGQAAKDAYGSNRRAVIGFTRIEAEMDISADEFDF